MLGMIYSKENAKMNPKELRSGPNETKVTPIFALHVEMSLLEGQAPTKNDTGHKSTPTSQQKIATE